MHWYTDHPNSLPSLISIATTASNPKQVWLTEVGSDRSDDIVQSNQLQNLVFIPFNGRGTGSLWAKIFVYRMTPYLSMGLLRSDGTARPSFSTFQFYSGGPLGPSVNVTLQAVNGWKYGSNGYVVAENGGGGAVNANRWSPGPWETFGLWDWNGGSVQHGDVVSFMTGTYQYLQPNSGGGGGMTAAGSPYNYGIFSIHRVAGPGAVAPGDIVYLQTLSGHYVVAEGGGGSVVNANRTSVGEWEQFRIAP